MKQYLLAIWLTVTFIGCSNPVEQETVKVHSLNKLEGMYSHYTVDSIYTQAEAVFRMSGDSPDMLYGFANEYTDIPVLPDSLVVETDSTKLVYATFRVPSGDMVLITTLVCKYSWTKDTVTSFICMHPVHRTPAG